MNKYIFVLVFAFFLNTAINAQKYGIIKGSVFDTTEKIPLPGTTVIILNTNLGCNTNIGGKYIVDSIPPGEYSIEIKLMGYMTNKVNHLIVKADSTYNIDIFLKPIRPPQKHKGMIRTTPVNTKLKYGTLEGHIFDTETKEPLPDAEIHVVNYRLVHSDLDGFYTIPTMPIGTYTIWTSCGPYKDSTRKTIIIKPGSIKVVDFYLKPAGPKTYNPIRTGPRLH